MDQDIATTESAAPQRKISGGAIIAVHRSPAHNFTKETVESIHLIAGLGVLGDAHFGKTVQHVVRMREDPTKPNIRQVHLIHAELHDELRGQGFRVSPGDIGENVTTQGLELLTLPLGTRLHLGAHAVVELTGLRNPCRQLDRFQQGLMSALIGRDTQGNILRKSGVMSIVVASGEVRAGDAIHIALPAEPHQPLPRV